MAKPDISGALEKLGLKTEGMDRIRLGRGVVGKTGYVAWAAMAVLGIVAYKLSGTVPLLALAGIAFLVFVSFLVGSYIFASKNPSLALMEGMEIIAYKKYEAAIKGVSDLGPSILIDDPLNPPIRSLPSNDDADG